MFGLERMRGKTKNMQGRNFFSFVWLHDRREKKQNWSENIFVGPSCLLLDKIRRQVGERGRDVTGLLTFISSKLLICPPHNFLIFFFPFLYSNRPKRNIFFPLFFLSLSLFFFFFFSSTIKQVQVFGKKQNANVQPIETGFGNHGKMAHTALVYKRHMECCLWQSRKRYIYEAC